ncbi:uncharacterized protein [Parasteatoda tepidariorum]|uniref:uncharacterized protein n=1 Tax=Parasteatoda tepidariorum TaxID=114398 RepID=UPI0039BCE5E0
MSLHILIALSILIIFAVTFGEIRKLMPVCSNSCLVGGDQSTRNCFCDSVCSLIYNDCCLDAPYRTFRMAIRRRQSNRCVYVHGENRNFWMVNKCKDSWTGREHIREKCIEDTVVSSETNDLMGTVPVTDPKEGVTYKNYYCALCNAENTENLVEWRVKALCSNVDVTQEDVLQNLTFIEEKQQWGVWKWENDEWMFEKCYLLFQKPVNVTRGIRSCIPGMVSSCPRSWQNITTRRLCKSYVDPIKWNDGILYKNMDCALCHNKSSIGYECYYDVARGTNVIMLNRALEADLSCSGQWF